MTTERLPAAEAAVHPTSGAGSAPEPTRTPRIHPAWWVAAAAFLAAVGAAGFRSVPGVLMEPLHMEFGWSMGTISSAVSINLVLYGLAAPFSAALMDRIGIKRVVVVALLLIAVGSVLPIWMTQPWQLLLCWGVVIGLGTGAMAMSFVAVVTGRWFVAQRGLVSGVLTAAAAAGQLVFLPLLASLSTQHGWRTAATVTTAAALLVIPVVVWKLHDSPASIGVRAYGEVISPAADPGAVPAAPHRRRQNPAVVALRSLRMASKRGVFWLLVGSFAICGMTTNGLVGTHFIPAAHDHGMAQTTAAGLLALVGIFDVVGTIFSGWLTDRFDPRWLLGIYYLGRGASLLVLPSLFANSVHPSMFVFILFYGLDWVATVPPTIALCRMAFGDQGPVVFGWVFASHQVGAAIAAGLAGLVRDKLGNYDLAWYVASALCLFAAAMCLAVRRVTQDPDTAGSPASVVSLQKPMQVNGSGTSADPDRAN